MAFQKNTSFNFVLLSSSKDSNPFPVFLIIIFNTWKHASYWFVCLFVICAFSLFSPKENIVLKKETLYFLFTDVFIGNNSMRNIVGAQELFIDLLIGLLVKRTFQITGIML